MRNIRLISLTVCLCAILVAAGCRGIEKEPPPENLIAEPVYIDLLIEMQHIRTYAHVEPDSLNVDSLEQVVFKKYDVTGEQFRASHRYYQSDVKGQIQRTEKAIARLEAEEQQIQAYIDSVEAAREAIQDSLAKPDSLARPDSLGN